MTATLTQETESVAPTPTNFGFGLSPGSVSIATSLPSFVLIFSVSPLGQPATIPRRGELGYQDRRAAQV